MLTIVGTIGVAQGWLDSAWLVVLAIALSFTFVLAAPANAMAHDLYARWCSFLKRFESSKRLPDEAPLNVTGATIAVIGLGGLGTAAYDEMRRRHGDVVIGIDFFSPTVQHHRQHGRRVALGDASDSDFWDQINPSDSDIRMVMLTLPDAKASAFAVRQLKARGYEGQIAASVRFEDEIADLRKSGIDAAFVLYQEAGVGFADYVCKHMDHCQLQQSGLTF